MIVRDGKRNFKYSIQSNVMIFFAENSARSKITKACKNRIETFLGIQIERM